MIGTIIELFVSLFDSVLCIYFITKFNRKAFRHNRLFIPAIIIYFGFTLFGDYFMSDFSVLSTIILLILSGIYALLISDKHPARAILSACIYKAVYILLSSLIYAIILMISNESELIIPSTGSIERYIILILHKISLFAILKLFLLVFKTDTLLDLKNGILTLIFSLTTIVGLGSTMFISGLPNASAVRVQILVITVAFIATNVFLYFLISQVQKLQQSKYELRLLQEKMRFEEARYNDANAIWSNVRKVQHDIKQHLTVISGYIRDNQVDECEEYLHKLLPTVDQMGKLIKSDNAILDYLINSKLCALENTQVVISGSVGSLSDIRDADLACLMGNILDNAIEAIENVEEKRIELLFSMQNSNRVIICKNTIEHSVLENNKELKSTKRDGRSHGFGHKIIAKIVSDYHGMVDYFEEFDMFGVQIVLPMPSDDLRREAASKKRSVKSAK